MDQDIVAETTLIGAEQNASENGNIGEKKALIARQDTINNATQKLAYAGVTREVLSEDNFDDDYINYEDEEPTTQVLISFFKRYRHVLFLSLLTLIAVMAAGLFMVLEEGQDSDYMFAINNEQPFIIDVTDRMHCGFMEILARGPIISIISGIPFNPSSNITVRICKKANSSIGDHVCDNESDIGFHVMYLNEKTNNSLQSVEARFDLKDIEVDSSKTYVMDVETTSETFIALNLHLHDVGSMATIEVYSAALILILLYVLIISEVVHRTVAAMVCSLIAVATLTYLKEGPSLENVIEWIDWETLMLLFGMMVLVAVFGESGFFDKVAVLIYKLAKGNTWYLIYNLCAFAAVISAFLDNVTTMLLMTPVTIKLCEALQFDPKYILIAEVLLSNIGGTATAIGDPPNVLIVSNPDVKAHGIDFVKFSSHMSIGAIFCMFVGMFVIRVLYYSKDFKYDSDPDIQQMKSSLHMWKKTANNLSTVTREEREIKVLLQRHVHSLQTTLHKRMAVVKRDAKPWVQELSELEKNYKIKDWKLLIKSGCVLLCVILLFFMQSTPYLHTDLGWIAVLGAVVLLVAADLESIEEVLHKVEWSTLIFFASLFVLMESIEKLHLIDFIGDLTQSVVLCFPDNIQFFAALMIIIWVSALASSFIDNIPYTSAMIPIVIKLGETDGLDVSPLLWALAFGACLGGNGTLIGASANLVCSGVAEQKGIKITFMDFFRVGFPVMLCTTMVATVYIFICHIWPFQWH